MTSTSYRTALYANVYARRIECPACSGPLEVTPSDEPSTLGRVTCAACHERHVIALANDPLRETFREYTEQEKKVMISADKSRKPPICPVDETVMDVHAQRSLGLNSNVTLRCRRCGHGATYVRLHG